MILTLRNLSGKSFQIDIDSDSTIYVVKQVLSNCCGIKAENIHFLFQSQLIPDSEQIKNISMSPNDFILFYEAVPESELNSISNTITTPPQLCHVEGAPSLSAQTQSPDFFSRRELQLMKPYLIEPVFSQVYNRPEIYAPVDPKFNVQFSSEFKPLKVPIEETLSKDFSDILKPNYPLVDVSEIIHCCVDQELKNNHSISNAVNSNSNFKSNQIMNSNPVIPNASFFLSKIPSNYNNTSLSLNAKPNLNPNSVFNPNQGFYQNQNSISNLNANSNTSPNSQLNASLNLNANSQISSNLPKMQLNSNFNANINLNSNINSNLK